MTDNEGWTITDSQCYEKYTHSGWTESYTYTEYAAINCKLGTPASDAATYTEDADGLLGEIVANIREVIQNILSWIVEQINRPIAVLQGLLDWARQTFSNMLEGIKSVIRAARDWIAGVYEVISDFIVRAVTAAKDMVVEMALKLRDGIIDFAKKIKDTLTLLINTVAGWIKTVATNIWEGIKAVGAAIAKAFHDTITWVKDKIKAIVDGLKTVVTTAKDWIVGVYDNIKSVISNIIDGITEGFKTGLDSVISFLQDLWEKITVLLDTLFDMSIEALTEVFIHVFTAQKLALNKLMSEAAPA